MSGPPKTWTDEDLLYLVLSAPEPFITAKRIIDKTGYSRENVHKRLSQLVEEGYLESKNVGSSAKIFWLTPEGRKLAAEE